MRCYKCMGELNEDNYCNNCGEVTVPQTISHLLVPGTILNNKFLIGNSIGEGGFGITYIGFDTTLNIRVAIKEYFPSNYANRDNRYSNDVLPVSQNYESFYQREKSKFLDEARNLAKFSNENGIVQVRDFFEENNTAYIVMEYLDGITLRDYISVNGVMDAETVFSLMKPVMQSLIKIHENHIIHRDISPDNIMFIPETQLKLMDFGSARQFSEENNTKTILYKSGYAPIEQHKTNGEQGPWTDVYGLCATIYKCITGIPPEDSIDRYMNDNLKSPSELGINIPLQLERILMYGLAVNHSDRCQTITELLDLTNNALDTRINTKMNDDMCGKQVTIPTYKGVNYQSGYSSQIDNATMSKTNSQNKNVYPLKENSQKLPMIIAIIITICVIIVASSVIYFVFNSMNTNKNRIVDVSDQENTEQNTSTITSSTVITDHTTQQTNEELTSIPLLDSATSFISADASSTLPDEYSYDYNPINVMYDDDTCWCENSSGVGIGEWIKLNLPETQLVSGLKIKNGYAGGTAKQYKINSKITDVLIEFSNGYSVEKTLEVYDVEDRNATQIIDFPNPIETSYVKLTIKGVDEGDCKDTCLTYVAPY